MDSNLVARWQALKVEIWNLVEKDPKFLDKIDRLVAERKAEEQRLLESNPHAVHERIEKVVDPLRDSFKD